MIELKLKFEQSGVESRDCMAPYKVHLNRTCTLQELIDEILKRGEYGYIGVESKLSVRGNPCCEYRQGEIQNSSFTEKDLKSLVGVVNARGGWYSMDYSVTLKKEENEAPRLDAVIISGTRFEVTSIPPHIHMCDTCALKDEECVTMYRCPLRQGQTFKKTV